jgi:hypothetical protein
MKPFGNHHQHHDVAFGGNIVLLAVVRLRATGAS